MSIFKGDKSNYLWESINNNNLNVHTHLALYSLCCACQQLEEYCNQLEKRIETLSKKV